MYTYVCILLENLFWEVIWEVKIMDKNKMLIVPKVGEKITTSLIGSGKIRRRCVVKKWKKESRSDKLHEQIFKRSNLLSSPLLKKPTKKPIRFLTSSSKIIFNYWNTLGHPFVHHKPLMSKVTSHGIDSISKATKRHGKEDVVRAMETAKKVFDADWFKWRLYIGSKKISLPDFFYYKKDTYKRDRKKMKGLPQSWYKECRKGIEYMERNYSVIKKDKLPHITENLVKTWKEYSHTRLTIKTTEQIKRFSVKLDSFCSSNNFDWGTIVDIINGMLNEWHTYKPKHFGYLLNELFLGEILPREIVRYGIVDNNFKWAKL